MLEQSYRAAPFIPTTPRSGENALSIVSGLNMILKGLPPYQYYEIYGGSEDLHETVDTKTLTGTLTVVDGSNVIVGVGTNFPAEMRIGQWVLVGGDLFVVSQVVDATSFIAARDATASNSGLTGYLMPVLYAVNQKRGASIRGNVRQFDKGNLLGVGDGVFTLDGDAISASLSLTRSAKLAVYDPDTDTYTIFTLGMDTPATPTAAELIGGIKNMQVGAYSVVLIPSRTATGGFNNPSEPAEVSITVAGYQIRVSSPAMDTVNGQDSWDVYGTQYTTQTAAINGPWYFVETVTAETLGTTGATAFNVEWRDAEINRNQLLTFNNDAPVDSEFIGLLTGTPIYVSCQGPGYPTVKTTSPGPIIVPSKPNNIEAAPLVQAVPLSPPETIIGFCESLARLFLLTPNSLQFAQFTGIDAFPVTARSYWGTGFTNPYQVIFNNDFLYGYTNSGPTRSIANAEEANEEHEFAQKVWAITKDWVPNQVLVAYDPTHNAVCFFHAADALNDDDWWTTKVLMFMLATNQWSTPIVLSRTDQDMIVSGVATVGDDLYFLAGGRTASIPDVRTFRFDGANEASDYFLAWQYSDFGDEFRPKNTRYAKAVGRFEDADIQIYGNYAGEAIDVASLELGTGSKSGSITVPDSSAVGETERFPMNVKNLKQIAPRIGGTWSGTGEKIRIDEVSLSISMEGARR